MRAILRLCALLGLLVMMANAKILVHGHRGARALRPENTLSAFRYAIEAGADVLELDLAVTKDDILVVSHDPVLPERLCQGSGGTRVIREMTLSEVKRWDCGTLRDPEFPRQEPAPGEKIPTLDEVLDLKGLGDFWFNIETKISPEHPEYTPSAEEFARMVAAAIARHGLERRVIVQSFDFRVLHAMGKIAPHIPLAALFGSGDEDFVEVAGRAGASIVAPNFKLVTAEKVKRAHDAGLQVVPWTPNSAAEWKMLVEAGVDAIITDDPKGLILFLKEAGVR